MSLALTGVIGSAVEVFQTVTARFCTSSLLLQNVAFPFKISNLPLNVGGQGVPNW